ncbi:hypothetical protein C4D60_Mb02t06970 [Musa balbisiana]|uniref:Uncharacterized protein n=1 Tax=Musa balbisiana TaxID=52838 RepID=A0A4S8I8U9_MUSBA|nr:hypothetical protein C4D60_Mb02t06970 [Musa balbisiana]
MEGGDARNGGVNWITGRRRFLEELLYALKGKHRQVLCLCKEAWRQEFYDVIHCDAIGIDGVRLQDYGEEKKAVHCDVISIDGIYLQDNGAKAFLLKALDSFREALLRRNECNRQVLQLLACEPVALPRWIHVVLAPATMSRVDRSSCDRWQIN